MYELMLEASEQQLDSLRRRSPREYSVLKRAWHDTRAWVENKGTRPARLLIPYIGSGLNRLAVGGLGSWRKLVGTVSKACGELGTIHQIKRAGLTFPQQLELHLREALRGPDPAVVNSVVDAFDVFNVEPEPSHLHARLASMFPVLITTNYNRILEKAATTYRPFDLTDDSIAPEQLAPVPKGSILHLHGMWTPEETRAHRQQIFWGVGDFTNTDKSRCLVMTEYQYHRLYNNREAFRKIVSSLFGPEHLMLFIGASLSSDESGIHAILTEQRIQGGNLAGVYVSLDLDPLREKLLQIRGIETLTLGRRFGYTRKAMEAAFHAFFDVCEKSFEVAGTAAAPPPCPPPEILCVGISSWNQVLGIPDQTLGTETSYRIPHSRYCPEAGGQHLYPALHLVQRGHRVILASMVGDDDLGDEVESRVRDLVEDVERRGGTGDLLPYFVQRRGPTRLSVVVTYGGTRVIFDYDGETGLDENLSPAELHKWRGLKAVYLGTYFGAFQKRVLDELPAVPLKFFETGTRGPKKDDDFTAAVSTARRCNYVLSSSEFLLRLAEAEYGKPPEHTQQCQALVREDLRGGGPRLRCAFETLWPGTTTAEVLVVVMGPYGSAVVRSKSSAVTATGIEPVDYPVGTGINWLGCGDMFRGEFIHQVLSGNDDPEDAAKKASAVVAARIQRKCFLEPLALRT